MNETPIKKRHIYAINVSVHDGIVTVSFSRRDAQGNEDNHSYAVYDWHERWPWQRHMANHLNRSVAALLAFQAHGLNVDTRVL